MGAMPKPIVFYQLMPHLRMRNRAGQIDFPLPEFSIQIASRCEAFQGATGLPMPQ
jgi:hypothetical protein